jgi:16S rRNA (guanine966-N2)-methyltransferase
MRVVAGSLGGRRIDPPPDRRARPTGDRVREGLFNALESRGLVDGARVLDLFAGTGALGIEALSRGAAHTTFVERDRAMRTVLARNLESLGLQDRSTVRAQSAERALAGPLADETFDLALLDPPYTFRGWPGVLEALPAEVAVIESDHPPRLPVEWQVMSSRRYGGTLVTFVERTPPPPHVVPGSATGGEQ